MGLKRQERRLKTLEEKFFEIGALCKEKRKELAGTKLREPEQIDDVSQAT